MTAPCQTCGLEPGDGCPWCAVVDDPPCEFAYDASTPSSEARGYGRRLKSWLGRVARTGNALRKDRRVPWPIRGALCVAPFCLAIPGPADEVMVGVCLGLLAVFWRPLLVEAWRGSVR